MVFCLINHSVVAAAGPTLGARRADPYFSARGLRVCADARLLVRRYWCGLRE
jgi:hypothetical protein